MVILVKYISHRIEKDKRYSKYVINRYSGFGELIKMLRGRFKYLLIEHMYKDQVKITIEDKETILFITGDVFDDECKDLNLVLDTLFDKTVK